MNSYYKKRLPIGIENFEEIRREDFYDVGEGESVYQAAKIWKIVEYEYAEDLS